MVGAAGVKGEGKTNKGGDSVAEKIRINSEDFLSRLINSMNMETRGKKRSPRSENHGAEVGRTGHRRSLSAKRGRRGRQLFPKHVTMILTEWFENNLIDPYPSPSEKEYLSMKCDITIKQLESWFQNKRKRDTRWKSFQRQLGGSHSAEKKTKKANRKTKNDGSKGKGGNPNHNRDSQQGAAGMDFKLLLDDINITTLPTATTKVQADNPLSLFGNSAAPPISSDPLNLEAGGLFLDGASDPMSNGGANGSKDTTNSEDPLSLFSHPTSSPTFDIDSLFDLPPS
eukprot:CAMPEP_0170195962 /NCGR_PEP_ID=MMETSP0040_2-20121228/62689_1 /TAXON_ID=641309 /ORGANISM="Lotharella oceanica, Strain CCMP622" /LENGTH=283 /DNA_ID=CAMNT_0010445259 /DNA_START=204 /DNA_END=1058 /DNA_ORIENTATION=+